MGEEKSNRTACVVGLFLAAALTFTPGCSPNPFDWGRSSSTCTDLNRDGYCDEDGRPVNSASRSSYYRGGSWFPYFGSSHSSGSSVSTPAGTTSHGVSTGSSGGIGSAARSGGGSSSGGSSSGG